MYTHLVEKKLASTSAETAYIAKPVTEAQLIDIYMQHYTTSMEFNLANKFRLREQNGQQLYLYDGNEYPKIIPVFTQAKLKRHMLSRSIDKIFGAFLLDFFTQPENQSTDLTILGRPDDMLSDSAYSRVHVLSGYYKGKRFFLDLGGLGGTYFDFIEQANEQNFEEDDLDEYSKYRSAVSYHMSCTEEINDFSQSQNESEKHLVANDDRLNYYGLESYGALLFSPVIESYDSEYFITTLGMPLYLDNQVQAPLYRQYASSMPTAGQYFDQESINELSNNLIAYLKLKLDSYRTARSFNLLNNTITFVGSLPSALSKIKLSFDECIALLEKKITGFEFALSNFTASDHFLSFKSPSLSHNIYNNKSRHLTQLMNMLSEEHVAYSYNEKRKCFESTQINKEYYEKIHAALSHLLPLDKLIRFTVNNKQGDALLLISTELLEKENISKLKQLKSLTSNTFNTTELASLVSKLSITLVDVKQKIAFFKEQEGTAYCKILPQLISTYYEIYQFQTTTPNQAVKNIQAQDIGGWSLLETGPSQSKYFIEPAALRKSPTLKAAIADSLFIDKVSSLQSLLNTLNIKNMVIAPGGKIHIRVRLFEPDNLNKLISEFEKASRIIQRTADSFSLIEEPYSYQEPLSTIDVWSSEIEEKSDKNEMQATDNLSSAYFNALIGKINTLIAELKKLPEMPSDNTPSTSSSSKTT